MHSTGLVRSRSHQKSRHRKSASYRSLILARWKRQGHLATDKRIQAALQLVEALQLLQSTALEQLRPLGFVSKLSTFSPAQLTTAKRQRSFAQLSRCCRPGVPRPSSISLSPEMRRGSTRHYSAQTVSGPTRWTSENDSQAKTPTEKCHPVRLGGQQGGGCMNYSQPSLKPRPICTVQNCIV